MVLSASFSLEPPLDMSAAMEKALAREDSWGLEDAVNSMVPGALQAVRRPQGDKDPKRSAKVPRSVTGGREFREGQLECPPRSCSLACRCLGKVRRNSDVRWQ